MRARPACSSAVGAPLRAASSSIRSAAAGGVGDPADAHQPLDEVAAERQRPEIAHAQLLGRVPGVLEVLDAVLPPTLGHARATPRPLLRATWSSGRSSLGHARSWPARRRPPRGARSRTGSGPAPTPPSTPGSRSARRCPSPGGPRTRRVARSPRRAARLARKSWTLHSTSMLPRASAARSKWSMAGLGGIQVVVPDEHLDGHPARAHVVRRVGVGHAPAPTRRADRSAGRARTGSSRRRPTRPRPPRSSPAAASSACIRPRRCPARRRGRRSARCAPWPGSGRSGGTDCRRGGASRSVT